MRLEARTDIDPAIDAPRSAIGRHRRFRATVRVGTSDKPSGRRCHIRAAFGGIGDGAAVFAVLSEIRRRR